MSSQRTKEIVIATFLVWIILSAVMVILRRIPDILGVSLGVLVSALNLVSLMSTIDQKEESKIKGTSSQRLTWLFFARYLLVALIFAILVGIPNQLANFLIGFLSLYAVFFLFYVKRLKTGTKR